MAALVLSWREYSSRAAAETESSAGGYPRSTSFRGPLPPPDVLRGYNDILPGAADRIIRMAEREGDHRRLYEQRELRRRSREATIGQFLGFGLALALIGGAVYSASIGYPWVATAMASVPLIGEVLKRFLPAKAEGNTTLPAKQQKS